MSDAAEVRSAAQQAEVIRASQQAATLADRSSARAGKPEELVLGRLLNEVYLLLDFLAAHPEKSFTMLGEMPWYAPAASQGCKLATTLCNKEAVLKRLASIEFPTPETPRRTDENIAFLLLLKDSLAQVVKSATGETIAFTEMVLVSQRRPMREPVRPAGNRPEASHRRPTTRNDLANAAYPELRRHAQIARYAWRASILGLFLLTLVTIMLTLAASEGRKSLDRLAAASQKYAAAAVLMQQFEAMEVRGEAGRRGSQEPTGTGPSMGYTNFTVLDAPPSRHLFSACDRIRMRHDAARTVSAAKTAAAGQPAFYPFFESYEQRAVCSPLWDADQEIMAARLDLGRQLPVLMALNLLRSGWENMQRLNQRLRSWDWSMAYSFFVWAAEAAPAPAQAAAGAPPPEDWNRKIEWRAEDALRNLAEHILPLLFSMLGAGVSIMRNFLWKLNRSELSPREVPLALNRLVLGITAGLVLGLFQATSPTPPGNLVAGVSAPGTAGIGFAPQALAFLAGYGLDSVFTLFDRWLRALRRDPVKPDTTPILPADARSAAPERAASVSPAMPSAAPGPPAPA